MARHVIDIPYVEPHGKAFRYRRIVPADVREQVGKAFKGSVGMEGGLRSCRNFLVTD